MQADTASDSSVLGAPVLSVLVPVYNEIDVLPEFHRRMTAVLRACVATYEVVYVNDGSSDGSLPVSYTHLDVYKRQVSRRIWLGAAITSCYCASSPRWR